MTYADGYARLVARHYDAINAELRGSSQDAAFYLSLARESGGPVLELGCGTGASRPIAREYLRQARCVSRHARRVPARASAL
jgi:ubiquinone/menaquinone biosynthesis C-methylase UbiE